jgi:hypothetical protein
MLGFGCRGVECAEELVAQFILSQQSNRLSRSKSWRSSTNKTADW